MRLCLPVALQPYLKKYLAYHYSVDPFILTEKNRYGAFLINSLRHKTKAEPEQLGMNMRYLTCKMEVELSEFYWRNFGNVIPTKCQYRFNNFLLDEFQEKMVEFVQPRLQRKGDLNMRLLTFREKFSILEDELPIKTMQKAWEREKNRITIYKSA
ncbi:MAG: hypothetical protein H7Y13_11930 [Sphingobacteriaceae bacterium]|nr:hypothetical protein [Sphingobacteriaceae bacterium]